MTIILVRSLQEKVAQKKQRKEKGKKEIDERKYEEMFFWDRIRRNKFLFSGKSAAASLFVRFVWLKGKWWTGDILYFVVFWKRINKFNVFASVKGMITDSTEGRTMFLQGNLQPVMIKCSMLSLQKFIINFSLATHSEGHQVIKGIYILRLISVWLSSRWYEHILLLSIVIGATIALVVLDKRNLQALFSRAMRCHRMRSYFK